MMRKIFNEVIRHECITPEAWRKVIIKMIFEQGDEERAENDRPTCTFAYLYTVFSTPLYNRLYSKLD